MYLCRRLLPTLQILPYQPRVKKVDTLPSNRIKPEQANYLPQPTSQLSSRHPAGCGCEAVTNRMREIKHAHLSTAILGQWLGSTICMLPRRLWVPETESASSRSNLDLSHHATGVLHKMCLVDSPTALRKAVSRTPRAGDAMVQR